MNKSNLYRLTLSISKVIGLLFSVLLAACSQLPPPEPTKVNSPLGLYITNTTEKYWLSIMTNNQYLLCTPDICHPGRYEKVAIDYGVILIDFFKIEAGMAVERLSFGESHSEEYYQVMKAKRLNQPRAEDWAFNLGDCRGIPCAGLGHQRNGVKFFKVENFDKFYH